MVAPLWLNRDYFTTIDLGSSRCFFSVTETWLLESRLTDARGTTKNKGIQANLDPSGNQPLKQRWWHKRNTFASKYEKFTMSISDWTVWQKRKFCLWHLNCLTMISENVHANNRFTELGISRLNNVIVQMFLNAQHSAIGNTYTQSHTPNLVSWSFLSAVTPQLRHPDLISCNILCYHKNAWNL